MPSLLDLMGYGGGQQGPQGATMPIPSFALGGMNMGGLPPGGRPGMGLGMGMGMGAMGLDLMGGRNPGAMAMAQPGRYGPDPRRRRPQIPPQTPQDPYAASDPYAQPMPWWLPAQGSSSGR